MAGTLNFEFRSGARGPRREGDTARLLLVGDFSARAHRGLAEPASLASRPVRAVDVDSLDAAVARCATRIVGTPADGIPVDLAIESIDDFHPDHLCEMDPTLAALLALRRRLLDPREFAAAAAELGAVATPPVTQASAAPPARETDQQAMERLLGSAPVRPAGERGAFAPGVVDAFLRQIVGAQQLAPELKFQAQYLAAVDLQASARLRGMLHLPAFQSAEALWRGVQMLVARLDLGDELELYLLDATPGELATEGALARRLGQLAVEAGDAGASWLAVVGLTSFGTTDLDLLASIGAAAGAAGMPFIAGAQASLAGGFDANGDWQLPDAATLGAWQALRAAGVAGSIGLVAPRFLLRLPYGKATDPLDGFAFEELAGTVPQPLELLWGEPALAAGLALARGQEPGALDVEDLPALSYVEDGERKLQPCTEWLLAERASVQVWEQGIMTLLGSRQRNAARLAGWRTIAAASEA
ncbi:MAG: type VI secretion system contractile sheath large subunit [Gammaproteobacteria bacterium]|nr:type VI secretion system contractile sheath large subunit [Gammaproteobacteria bacterium]